MAYARVARAVRMTILLQSKLIADLQALESTAAHEAAQANSLQGTQRVCCVHDQKRRIGRTVARIAWADRQDHERAQRLGRETVERLEQDELYGDILTRPFSEIIAHICRDLGQVPDSVRNEINTGRPGIALAALWARPPPQPAPPDTSPDDAEAEGP